MRVSWVVASAVLLAGCGTSSGEFSISLDGNQLEVERGSAGALAVTLLADEAFNDEVTVRAEVTPETSQSIRGLAFVNQTFPADRKVTFEVPIGATVPAGTEFDVEVVAISAQHRATARMHVVAKDAGGAPDRTFGSDGRSASPTLASLDGICAMAPATARLTVFAGVEAGEYVLRAFDDAGEPAVDFGTAGVVRTGILATSFRTCKLLRDADGGLLLVGHRVSEDAPPLFISRYVSSGALDATYGSGGVAFLRDAYGDSLVDAVAHPGGGAVVVASTVVTGDSGAANVLVLLQVDRLGQPVMDFGFIGRAVYPDAPIAVDARLAVTADMGLLVARTNYTDQSDVKLVVERILPSGDRDVTWARGKGSTVVSVGGEYITPVEVLVQQDGKVLVGSRTALGRFDLRRFSSDGTVDTGFGTVGVVSFRPAGAYAHAAICGLALDASGRIIAAVDHAADSTGGEARLVRLQPDGSFDATFGWGGHYKLLGDFYSNSGDTLVGVSVLPDGRIVTVGDQRTANGRFYFATRDLP